MIYMDKVDILQLNAALSTHNNSFSRNTTGSGSLMAAFSSPRASSDEYGASTFKPGQAPYHAAKHYMTFHICHQWLRVSLI